MNATPRSSRTPARAHAARRHNVSIPTVVTVCATTQAPSGNWEVVRHDDPREAARNGDRDDHRQPADARTSR